MFLGELGSWTFSLQYICAAAPPSTPCTRPRVRSCPGARGGAPEENFGLYNAFLDKKRYPEDVQHLVRKPSSSPARTWAHGCVSCETRGQIGRWCGGTGRVDVRVRAAAHAGRAGRGTAGAHLGLGWTGISPSNLHGGQLRRARARRAAAQLQASCPVSAGQEPCPVWSRKLRLSEK